MHRHLPSGFLVPPTGSVTSCHHQVDVSTKRKKKKIRRPKKERKSRCLPFKTFVGWNNTHDIFRLIVFFLFPRRKDQWPSQTIEFESEWRSNESNLDSLYKEKCSNVRVAKQKRKRKNSCPFHFLAQTPVNCKPPPVLWRVFAFFFFVPPFFFKKKKEIAVLKDGNYSNHCNFLVYFRQSWGSSPVEAVWPSASG